AFLVTGVQAWALPVSEDEELLGLTVGRHRPHLGRLDDGRTVVGVDDPVLDPECHAQLLQHVPGGSYRMPLRPTASTLLGPPPPSSGGRRVGQDWGAQR